MFKCCFTSTLMYGCTQDYIQEVLIMERQSIQNGFAKGNLSLLAKFALLLVVLTSMAYVVVADTDELSQNTAVTTSTEVDVGADVEVSTEVSSDVRMMVDVPGAQLRLLQLERELTRQIVQAEIVVSYVSEIEGLTESQQESVVTLKRYVERLHLYRAYVEQAREDLDQAQLSSSEAAKVFVTFRHDANAVARNFRQVVSTIITDSERGELAQFLAEQKQVVREEYKERLAQQRQAIIRERVATLNARASANIDVTAITGRADLAREMRQIAQDRRRFVTQQLREVEERKEIAELEIRSRPQIPAEIRGSVEANAQARIPQVREMVQMRIDEAQERRKDAQVRPAELTTEQMRERQRVIEQQRRASLDVTASVEREMTQAQREREAQARDDAQRQRELDSQVEGRVEANMTERGTAVDVRAGVGVRG